MDTTTLVILIVAAPALVWAFVADRRSWKRKSRDELIGMAGGQDWRRWKAAIAELQRRGEDTTVFIPSLLRALVSESRVTREAARITLVAFFPDMKLHLKEFSASEDVAMSRKKIAALLARYGIQDP
jgi:hypothetical protein